MTANNSRSFICGLVYIFVVVVAVANAVKLPEGFIRCQQSSPTFNECLKDAAQKSIPYLANGIPSLGINKIDPMRITQLVIDQGSGPVSLKLIFNEIDIHNMGTALLTQVNFNPETLNLFVELHPRTLLVLDGDYEVSGKVLILPVVGKGKCNITLEVPNVTGNVQLKTKEKNGKTYLEIDKFGWKFVTTHMTIDLENLFNGDKALGDNMNLFVNENWRDILKELQPAVEEVLGVAFGDVAQQFLKRIPYKDLYIP